MIRKVKKYTNPNESAFLGLFEGRKKKAEAEARIKILKAKTAAAEDLEKLRQEATMHRLESIKQGYDPETAAANQAIAVAKLKQQPEQTLYIMLAVVVVVVMVGMYFIKRKK